MSILQEDKVPLSITTKEAAKMIKGIELKTLQSLCITGKLKAQNINKRWYIDYIDLHRVFLGKIIN